MPIVHASPLPPIDIHVRPITDHVLRRAGDVPDRPALIEAATGRSLTFAQLDEAIHRCAGGLSSRGFAAGDTLALIAPNMPEYPIVFHGAAVAGGTVTTVNPAYHAEEIRYQLQDASATKVVTVPGAVDTALEAMEGTRADDLIVIGEHPDAVSLDEVNRAEPMDQVAIDPRTQVVVLPYSSGTTGLPKGVMLTHANLVTNIQQVDAVMNYEDDTAGIAVLPFFHIYGMQVLMNGLLSNGATVVTMPRFDLEGALQAIQEHKITHYYAVPPMVLALAKQPIVENYDLSSLRMVVSGAAPLGADLAAEASERIGCQVVQAYGMTEMSPVSHLTRPGDYRPGSVGVTVSNTEIRIVDEDGVDQDRGGVGELWVRGPLNMVGYLNNPEATATTIDADGWLHTGDVATIDEHDHVYIVDRVKELIKYKGFQVAPAELEALLITHLAVADVAVVGIEDLEAGELPKAFVTLKPGAEASSDELMAFVADHVATYKQIREVEFIDEIPKSASGKILRRFLRERA